MLKFKYHHRTTQDSAYKYLVYVFCARWHPLQPYWKAAQPEPQWLSAEPALPCFRHVHNAWQHHIQLGASGKLSPAGDAASETTAPFLAWGGWGVQRAPHTNWQPGNIFIFSVPICFSLTRAKIASSPSFFFPLHLLFYPSLPANLNNLH